MNSSNLLYLDDLRVGLTFRSLEHLIDADQIKTYAAQFDPQPFHLDEDAARDTFFKGLAASGWHTAAITMRLLVESMPLAGGVIGAGGEIGWPSATRAGDMLHVESNVVEVTPSRSRPDRGLIVVDGQTLNQHGDVRQVLRAKLLAFKRKD